MIALENRSVDCASNTVEQAPRFAVRSLAAPGDDPIRTHEDPSSAEEFPEIHSIDGRQLGQRHDVDWQADLSLDGGVNPSGPCLT